MSGSISILFICAGNTCRSPMAGGILRQLLERRLGPAAEMFRVDSAGIGGRAKSPATREAVRTLQRRGIDLTGHESKRVTKGLISGANLILTMTGGQREAITDLAEAARGKTFTLKEFVAACGLHSEAMSVKTRAKGLAGRVGLAVEEGIARAVEMRSLGDAIEEIGGELAGALRTGDGLDRSHLGSFDIADPYGGSTADYERCAEEVEELLERLVEFLLEGAGETPSPSGRGLG